MRYISHTADKITKKITRLSNEYNIKDFSKCTWKDGFKNLLLHDDSLKVVAKSSSEFEFYYEIGGRPSVDNSYITSSLISDFVINSRRVKQQYRSALEMKSNSNIAAPWVLVSIYYAAFFAANEILRTEDVISIGLNDEEFGYLLTRNTMNLLGHKALFEKKGSRNYHGMFENQKIVFKSVGTKPHEQAWKKVSQTLKSCIEQEGWHELTKYVQISDGVGGWSNPSQTRNLWNYKRADFYSKKGQQICQSMYQNFGATRRATDWLERGLPLDDASNCAALASIAELLSAPVIQSYERLFTTEILI